MKKRRNVSNDWSSLFRGSWGRGMKLAMFLSFAMCFQLSAAVFSESKGVLNLKAENEAVKEILKLIEGQSEYRFIYNSSNIDVNQRKSIAFQGKSIEDALDVLFKGTDVEYRSFEQNYVLFSKQKGEVGTAQQQKTITGKVVDDRGEPLPGVTVVIKGTTQGTITNMDGEYSLSGISSGASLMFSFVGMKSQEITIQDQTLVNIEMVADAIGLEEVVAIGYGTTIKRKAVGAISTIKAEKLEETPFNTMGEALQGQVPGLIVHNSGGKPGDLPSISIRGGATPLFVIDGVIKDEYSFSVLNPEDIASISFLKDASATAIYGSRAGDGIVLVTTKRGEKGKMKLRYSSSFELSQPTVLPDLNSSYEFARVANDAATFDGSNLPYSDEQLAIIKNHGDLQTYPDNDWIDLTLKDFATKNRHNLSMTGGDEKTNYFVSIGYLDQGGLLKANSVNLKRFNLRSNVTSSFKKIGLDVSLNLSADLQNSREPSAGTNQIFRFATSGTSPMWQAYNEDGTFAAGYNIPVVMASKESGYIKNRIKNINSQLSANWKVPGVEGLTTGVMGSYKDQDYYDKTWTLLAPQYYPDGSIYSTLDPTLNLESGYGYVLDFEGRLAYKRSFGDHSIDAIAVYTQREGYNEEMEGFRKNFTSSVVDQLFAGSSDGQTNNGTAKESGSAGVVGRVKYDYASRYIIELSGRYDGNDNFAKDQRWGFFPAISGAWVLGDEPFMQSLKERDFLTNLKIRGGWGKTGITTGVTRFGYVPKYNLVQNAININDLLLNGYSEGDLVNPDELSWYTRKSTNVGVDFAMLNNSLEGSFDYFYYETTGYLMSPENQYSGTLGKDLPQIKSNSEHRRSGAEMTLRYRKKINEVFFEVGGNISYYDQLWNVKDDEDNATLKNPYTRVTQQKDYFTTAYISDGLFQNGEDILNSPRLLTVSNIQNGDIRYVDSNGDGKIDENDMRRIGKPDSPHFVYGLDFRVNYRAWSLSGLIQGTGKRYVDLGSDIRGAIPRDILRKYQLDYWTPDNTDAFFPRISNAFANGNGAKSDYWYKNAAYVRLKNLQLKYDIKHRLLKNFDGISACQIVLTGSNLITFSDVMDYFDPESVMANPNKSWSGNVSGAGYPIQRTYSLGLNVEF